MAFNWQTFRTRSLTAAVFVVVMLTGLLWNQWSFLILFSIIHFGSWWEYLKLTEKIYNTNINKFSKFLLMDMGYILFWLIGFKDHETPGLKIAATSITISQALIFLMITGAIVFLLVNKEVNSKAKWISLGGFIYVSLSLGLMIDLRKEYFISEVGSGQQSLSGWHEIIVPCAIIFSIWINDTMAYVVGSLIGKTPLSKISPKKTVEGTLGGIVLAIIVAAVIAWLSHFDIKVVIIIAAIASVVGTFGDLLESKLKRMAGVKDSGHIMPGHGGFLDRFDSLLLAVPAVWMYVYFFPL